MIQRKLKIAGLKDYNHEWMEYFALPCQQIGCCQVEESCCTIESRPCRNKIIIVTTMINLQNGRQRKWLKLGMIKTTKIRMMRPDIFIKKFSTELQVSTARYFLAAEKQVKHKKLENIQLILMLYRRRCADPSQ